MNLIITEDLDPTAYEKGRQRLKRHEYYNGVIDHSLNYLSAAFNIKGLEDNKRPIDDKEYIAVNEYTDTLTIQSLFKKNSDYVIPRVSVVNLDDKLGEVYDEEIKYLKDTFNKIGRCYDSAEFDSFKIIFSNVHDGLFSFIVRTTSSYSKYPLQIKRVITLETLSRNINITSAAHDIFANIRSKFIEDINRCRNELISTHEMNEAELNRCRNAMKIQLNSVYGMTGGDFDGDVLYKEYLDERIKSLRESIYREFGVPESVIRASKGAPEVKRAMAAIRSTSGNYKGGYMRDYTSMYGKAIKKVIFNDPATVVMWNDGTKTVVKKHGDVEFNGEAAVMYAYVLRWHFNNNRKSMRIWLKQNAKRFEWQSEEPKKITVTRTTKGKITKASQKEIYETMTPEQKEVVDAMIQDAVKESKKTSKATKKVEVKNEDAK